LENVWFRKVECFSKVPQDKAVVRALQYVNVEGAAQIAGVFRRPGHADRHRPVRGGTQLPVVVLVAPDCVDTNPTGIVASRARHTDVGA